MARFTDCFCIGRAAPSLGIWKGTPEYVCVFNDVIVKISPSGLSWASYMKSVSALFVNQLLKSKIESIIKTDQWEKNNCDSLFAILKKFQYSKWHWAEGELLSQKLCRNQPNWIFCIWQTYTGTKWSRVIFLQNNSNQCELESNVMFLLTFRALILAQCILFLACIRAEKFSRIPFKEYCNLNGQNCQYLLLIWYTHIFQTT